MINHDPLSPCLLPGSPFMDRLINTNESSFRLNMFPGGMKLNDFVKLYKQNNANEPTKKRDRLNSLEMLSINI